MKRAVTKPTKQTKDNKKTTKKLTTSAKKTGQSVKHTPKKAKVCASACRSSVKTKTAVGPSPKKKVTKTVSAKKGSMVAKAKAAVRKAKTRTISATAKVLETVKKFKKGVGISEVAQKTHFDAKKVRTILSRAFTQGKVRRIGQGVYVGA